VLDIIEGRVDKSLVNSEAQGGTSRYSLLESIRQFGTERLEAGHRQQVRLAHVRHYASLIEAAHDGVRSPEQSAWTQHVRRELDNLRVAVATAVEAGDVDLSLRLTGGMLAYLWARTFPEAPENALLFQQRFVELREIADSTVAWCSAHGAAYDFDRCEADRTRAPMLPSSLAFQTTMQPVAPSRRVLHPGSHNAIPRQG
jgi:hypothetical protein